MAAYTASLSAIVCLLPSSGLSVGPPPYHGFVPVPMIMIIGWPPDIMVTQCQCEPRWQPRRCAMPRLPLVVTVTVRSFTITTTSSTASNPRAHHAHASANIQARTFISASILLADPESTTLVRLISPARARPSGSGPATTPAPEVRPALGRLRVRQRECRLLRRCLRRRQPRLVPTRAE
eukprot:2531996-Rhodomonas_salina.1